MIDDDIDSIYEKPIESIIAERSSCELCTLTRIDEEFYICDEFIIISCENCKVPMVVPFEHINPGASGYDDLRSRMEKELTKVAYRFYGDLEFAIDRKENKIPKHMHWHARRLRAGAPKRLVLKNKQILKDL